MKLRINDSVVVIAGKNKGMTGKVTKISLAKNTVVVEGVNKKVRNVKRRGIDAVGDQVEFFAPIDASNVAVVDPKNGKPTRIGYKTENGQKVRFAKSSGTVIPNSVSVTKAS